MRSLFEKKGKISTPPIEDTSEKLANRLINLKQDEEEITKQINDLIAEIQKPENKPRQPLLKREYMQLIKKKKMIEANINEIEVQRFNNDTLALNQENVQSNIDAMNPIKSNPNAMKIQMKEVVFEGLNDKIIDLQSVVDECNEISVILAGGTSVLSDENDLNSEFAEMSAEMGTENLSLDGVADEPIKLVSESTSSNIQTN